jgi:predicted RecB family nuclease
LNTITPSLLYNHLTCQHRVTMDAFADPALRGEPSPFIQLLWERGSAVERDTMSGLGQPFLDLSGLHGDEKEAATRAALARGEPLIYSGRLSVDDLLGEPDLLRREPSSGLYIAIDIKSGAGSEGGDDDDDGTLKKKYGVQLALYTDLLRRLDLSAGDYGFIWDVRGRETRYELHQPLTKDSLNTIWNLYLNTRLAVQTALAAPGGQGVTTPAAASVCKQCVWRKVCLEQILQANDLTLLPELGRAKRDAMITQFPTVADLAASEPARFIRGKKTDFPGVGPSTLHKFHARARLRAAGAAARPYLTAHVDFVPKPVTEVYFDIEDDPMRDLVYLHGFVVREGGDNGSERYESFWAEDVTDAAERDAFAGAWQFMQQHREALIVYYSKHERTKYRKLAEKHPGICTVADVDALFVLPRSLDLYHDVVRSRSEWPTMDFSVKTLAKFLGFAWRDTDPSGAASIEWYDRWAREREPALKQRLLDYNEDDCRAMRVVLDAVRELEVRE